MEKKGHSPPKYTCTRIFKPSCTVYSSAAVEGALAKIQKEDNTEQLQDYDD